MQIQGKIKLIKDIQTFDSGFYKRQIIVTEDSQYPNDIPIDFLKDKADCLDDYKEGQEVKVSINIKGSEYNGNNYVSINGWKIQPTEQHSVQGPPPVPADEYAPPIGNPNSFEEEEHEDLPF